MAHGISLPGGNPFEGIDRSRRPIPLTSLVSFPFTGPEIGYIYGMRPNSRNGKGEGSLPTVENIEVIRKRAEAAVRRTCPDWLSRQAEDIVQNVILQFLSADKKSEGKKRYSAIYVEKAVFGATMDQIRHLYRRKEKPVEELDLLEQADDRQAGPEKKAAAGEIGSGIRDCLAGLARNRRLAVILYLQGCTVPKAAQHLMWTLKKTENLVYRGLSDLRGCLAGKGIEP